MASRWIISLQRISPLTAKTDLREKAARLRNVLHGFGQVGIAFSGGVDSSLLLRSAIDALGAGNVLALHARSCLQKKVEQERAASWPERHGLSGVRMRIIDLQPLGWQDVVRNPPNRCCRCKRRMCRLFQDALAEDSIAVLLDGTNCDDLQQGEAGRPGLRALAELGVRTPLADCGLSKAEIRELSRELGLDTWNQPSASCLATRLPPGMEITAERLEWVDVLEQELAKFGFSACRARLVNDSAQTVCLQLRREDLDRFCVPAVRQKVCNLLKNKGADKILLDLDGR